MRSTDTAFNLGVNFNHGVAGLSFMAAFVDVKLVESYCSQQNGIIYGKPVIRLCSRGKDGQSLSIDSERFENKEEATVALKRLNLRIRRFLNKRAVRVAVYTSAKAA